MPANPLIQRQSGITLLEVLISIVIIAFGLLGVAAMQITGLKNNHSAYHRATANILAYDMLDRMRANKKGLIDGSYDTGGSFLDGKTTPGSAGTMAQTDKELWLTQLGNQLPGSKGKIEAAANAAVLRVTVQWNDERAVGGSSSQLLSVETQGCTTGEICYF